MILDSIGIILRKNNNSVYKLTVLDKIQGKIECVASKINMSVGSLVTYTVKRDQWYHHISNIQLVYIPLSLAHVDILFLHHVLELIYYFTYSDHCIKNVFDLLQFLYTSEDEIIAHHSKKIFLLKLFANMDIVPNVSINDQNFFTDCITIKMHELTLFSLNKSDEKKLDDWLWSCMYQHPHANAFQTAHFLSNNRII